MCKILLLLQLPAIWLLVQGENEKREDCQGFTELSDEIEALSKAYKVIDSCRSFANCSGIRCSGSGYGNAFNISVGMEQCDDPLRLWMHLKVPKINVDEWRELRDGRKQVVLKDVTIIRSPFPIKASASLNPSLKRMGGNITIGGELCLSFQTIMPFHLPSCQLIPEISVPLSPSLCSGIFTTSPTNAPITVVTSKMQSTIKPMIEKKKSTDSEPEKGKSGHDSRMTPTKHSKMAKKSERDTREPQVPNAKAHKNGQKSGMRGMSTGTKVAIVTSVLLAAMLLVGLFAYWRKLKKQRPVYYNDVTVNASDDDVIMDTHLVL